MLAFWVPGKARPKGSLAGRCLRNRAHTVVMREQVDNKRWRAAIAREARAEWKDAAPVEEPVGVLIAVFFERERTAAGALLPSHSTEYPCAPEFGDEDKHSRMVKDALQDAGALKDDRYVVECHVSKLFVTESVRTPGAHIRMTIMPSRPIVVIK